jgi:hypothetical protein
MAGHRRRRTDSTTWHRPAPRLPRGLVITTLTLAALSIGLPNIAPGVEFMSAPGSPVRLFFGVSEEMNLWTFFSVMLLVVTACSHALVGHLAGGRLRSAFLLTAAVLAMLGFDDFTALHERLNGLGALFGGDGAARYAWMLPATPVAAAMLVAFWRLVTHIRGAARRDLLLGIVVFFFAALVLEGVGGLLDQPGTEGMPLQIVTHVEEVTENLGVILVLRGALSMIEISRGVGGFALRLVSRPDAPVRRLPAQFDDDATERLPVLAGRR